MYIPDAVAMAMVAERHRTGIEKACLAAHASRLRALRRARRREQRAEQRLLRAWRAAADLRDAMDARL